MMRPGLTTVDVPKKQRAEYSLQLLVLQDQVHNKKSASIVLPTNLIGRESCGAKKINCGYTPENPQLF